MFYYILENNKIKQFAEIPSEQTPPTFMAQWLKTEDKIIRLRNGSLVFEKDVDMQAELQAEWQEVKVNKIAQLKAERDKEEQSPLLFKDYFWDFDDKAIQRINGAIIALSNGGTITWTSADNEEIRNVNADDLRGVISASAVRSNILHVKYRQLREQVEQATSIDEVNAIEWED